ncbi:MAG TPA: DUF2007 domain-containing protein [Anaeromyxobacteraceae bacterium]|nr:DUF2007 domain-containing protein [Anaeromyxobacteraceae bacterium]
MLAELLESAGISSVVEDLGTAGILPLSLGGARVLVPSGDAPRAREIVGSSGVFRGAGGDGEEIPQEEWEAPPSRAEDEPRGRGLGGRLGATLGLVLGALFLAALIWLALSGPSRPELPERPWRTPPARRPFP